MQSERSQTQKVTDCMILWNVQNRQSIEIKSRSVVPGTCGTKEWVVTTNGYGVSLGVIKWRNYVVKLDSGDDYITENTPKTTEMDIFKW